MKIAIAHEFLTQYGGAERVLECFMEMYPRSDIFTLVYYKDKMGDNFRKYNIKTSFVQKLPAPPPARFKWWLPLYPKAIESFDLSSYDLVISNSSAFAKGVKTKKPTTHICYMLTPTRYLWSSKKEYIEEAPIPSFIRPIMPPFINYLKKWDFKAAQRPDYIIGISNYIQKRIAKYYHRKSDVIYPFVDTEKFSPGGKISDYYLISGRMVPYKHYEIVISAFNKMPSLKLKVVGDGVALLKLQNLVKSENIEFLGRVNDNQLKKYYQECLAYIFPADEDFGITPLEANASGRPVIAYEKGGVLETIIPGKTGEFFIHQTTEAVIKAVEKFDATKYNSPAIRKHALTFSKEVFKEKFRNYINKHTTNQH